MANWPGANGGSAASPAGSSSSVHESWVSGRRRRTRWATGTIGPAARAASVSGDEAIHVEQPQPRRLQSLHDDLGEALHELVAESRVLLALAAQARAVERDGAHDAECAGVVDDAVRRDEPGPTEHVAAVE